MNDNAAKWVAALRSGDYGQFVGGGLSTIVGNHCCLGVACALYLEENADLEVFPSRDLDISRSSVEKETVLAYRDVNDPDTEGSDQFLPEKVYDWLGLSSNDGSFSELYYTDEGKSYDSLAEVNDSERFDFKQIANIIEEKEDELFAF